MQNQIPKFRQSANIPETPGYLLEKFDEHQPPQSLLFLLKFCTLFQKGIGIFFILFKTIELLIKM